MQSITLLGLATLLAAFAKFIIIFGIIIGVVFIIWSGIMYMTSSEDIARKNKAKSQTIKTVISLLIVLGVGVIIQTLAVLANGSSL